MPGNPFEPLSNHIGATLRGKFNHAWVEETIPSDASKKNNKFSYPETKNFLGKSITAQRRSLFLLLCLVGILMLWSKSTYLQILHGSSYRELAEGNRLRRQVIPSERGIMYDRFSRELIQNIPSFNLSIVPQDFPHIPSARSLVIAKLANLSGVSAGTLDELIKKYAAVSFESLVIKENLDYETALRLYLASSDLPGVLIENSAKRFYVYATSTPSTAHLLGYLAKLNSAEYERLHEAGYVPTDSIGKTGLEKTYEAVLRGHAGKKKIEVNALGREQNILAVDPPTPGRNLELTLDIDAQTILESAVKRIAKQTGKQKIAALAMNPEDGSIIALVSWPTYNNNEFSGGVSSTVYTRYINDPNHPLFNRVVAGLYPPGSTVKLIVSAAALAEKIITTQTAFLSTGGLQVGDHFFKDWKAGGHGLTNVTKALAWSVNTFFYYVGGGYEKFIGLGIDRLRPYLLKFNLAQPTGIDLPNEQAGFIPSKDWKHQTKKEPWYVGDTYNLSIGQGDLLVTPLQAAVWTAVVANGGTVVQPHLVQKIIDPLAKTNQLFRFTSKSTNLSPADLRIVREGMRDCVTYGSCKLLQTLPFHAAAKTGTAQWSNTHPTHAWFTSFAPYEAPKIVVTVLVEEGGEGATVAMPIARDFLAWWGKKYLTHP